MALYRFFKKQVPEVPSPNGPLARSLSPATIKDTNAAVNLAMCRSQLSSCREAEGNVRQFTPETQAAIAKYAFVHGAIRHFTKQLGKEIKDSSVSTWIKYSAELKRVMRISKIELRNFILREISNLCENLHQRKFPAIRY